MMLFKNKRQNNQQIQQEVRDGSRNREENKFQFPTSFVSKYILPSVGVDVFNGTHCVSGSCTMYDQIGIPNTKFEKLKIIGAEDSDKFFSEPGICQYFLPYKMDVPIAKCDIELKPNWNYIRPFTGHGILSNSNGPIVLHLYLTEAVEPQNGHLMVFYDDDGNIYGRYQFQEELNQWQEVDRFDTWINPTLKKITPHFWKIIIERLMKIEDYSTRRLSAFTNLFLLSNWKKLGKPLPNKKVMFFSQKVESISYLLMFTSEEHIKEYVEKLRKSRDISYAENYMIRSIAIEKLIHKQSDIAGLKSQEILVNPGPYEFMCGAYEIPEIYEWLLKEGELKPERFQE